jgi:hypothetical protein
MVQERKAAEEVEQALQTQLLVRRLLTAQERKVRGTGDPILIGAFERVHPIYHQPGIFV